MTCQFQNHTEKDVAPFVGVWIEMASYFCLGGKIMVAPFVGVWIEIKDTNLGSDINTVAPFVGVWIEIKK